ncbi:Flavoprotein domain-containing protein [Rozella allomycis CSF55]|uniref:Flavoprotein domain-containing protein n=1 Tax=Rozella allomycis (strain CSF55) TaxID=988480 RepID=A0A075AWC2_ROZAC|nr:Flavoprotein domain-containing protein [Rozella allomycis CSF55]|eukprot:EPZ34462.1 Flavoprotein domain-containing protein [Rozella allomycis CSF55]
MNILVGVTGSVATVKLEKLLHCIKENIKDRNIQIKIVTTARAKHFLVNSNLGSETILDDDSEWLWEELGDPVLHIQLREWADVFLIAPLSANSLAKISHGICDNLLTCIARAWDFRKPFLVAPAMNVHMWNHPLTSVQLRNLESWGIQIIPPISKKLACGDIGIGAMEEPECIATKLAQVISEIYEA